MGSIWFPDNRLRRDRVLQLSNDISNEVHKIAEIRNMIQDTMAKMTEENSGLENSIVGRSISMLFPTFAVTGILTTVSIPNLLSFGYYEMQKQCNELQRAIRDLYVRRILVKHYSMLCEVIWSYNGMLQCYNTLAAEGSKSAAEMIAKTMCKKIQADWDRIDLRSILDSLILKDKQRGSWTNEDPSYEDAIKEAELATKENEKQDEVASFASTTTFSEAMAAPTAGNLIDSQGLEAEFQDLNNTFKHLNDTFSELIPANTESPKQLDFVEKIQKMSATNTFDRQTILSLV